MSHHDNKGVTPYSDYLILCIYQTEEAMHETERLYNELNEELHRELPKFYNYRIDFIASNLSRLYSTESTFHSETGKVCIHCNTKSMK